MGKLLKKMTPAAKVALIITTVLAFGLLIFGALTPPPGEIHPSILKAVGEMFGFAALWIVAHALFEEKTDVHIKHGETEVNINTDEDEDQ